MKTSNANSYSSINVFDPKKLTIPHGLYSLLLLVLDPIASAPQWEVASMIPVINEYTACRINFQMFHNSQITIRIKLPLYWMQNRQNHST
ncbi:hypothetical protein QQP08_018167 [Theobroma cacao]|nr:hypothetical protein QQP08_017384 [Theobroma cacao]WRX25680.1 hypothetical protein QQP08_018167 [Theobroma cacao]